MAGTRWIKIDTTYLRNSKMTAISAPAVLLHLSSICWTADQTKDGLIPATNLADVSHDARIGRGTTSRRVDELVAGGLWIPNGKGFEVHDFAEMNPQAMRAAVEAQRAKWTEWQKKRRSG